MQFIVLATAIIAIACQPPKELTEKAAKLETELSTCRSDLKSAEAAKRNLEKKLAQNTPPAAAAVNVEEVAKGLGIKPGDKLYATFDTSMGKLVAELYWDKVPNTVLNFVQLAEGTKEWTDPRTNKQSKKPLYDGTKFHRVIPDFMIQGGDPLGTGTGGPGYQFADELHPDLKHTVPGILSMANSGRNTNGSQFFITEKATPWLDGKHSVFGKIIDGADLIPKITRVPKADGERGSTPAVDILLKKVSIGRGAPAK
jgi:peptidyl-prolyl cis-trans isomerase A (cyclophilin A)